MHLNCDMPERLNTPWKGSLWRQHSSKKCGAQCSPNIDLPSLWAPLVGPPPGPWLPLLNKCNVLSLKRNKHTNHIPISVHKLDTKQEGQKSVINELTMFWTCGTHGHSYTCTWFQGLLYHYILHSLMLTFHSEFQTREARETETEKGKGGEKNIACTACFWDVWEMNSPQTAAWKSSPTSLNVRIPDIGQH